MDGKRQGNNNSSSSFTAELFGDKESTPQQSSAGIFASIFPPPSKAGTVVGRNSANSDLIGSWQKHAPGNQAWPTTKHGNSVINGEGARSSMPNKDRSSVLQEERVEPCHLSSSLYYGGQDVYSQSPSTRTSAAYPIFKKDGGEDDPNGSNSSDASRGNWWQGD
ncbi:hypothetical protein L484_025327 [Morus notabilis]|uniref:Uncharacterized protein n=1 Tax=Morus notabilis TaxID=981085 RepID=W9S535_9ROSA|nr:hypothetical protein L484_025327 [Morus notabilis]